MSFLLPNKIKGSTIAVISVIILLILYSLFLRITVKKKITINPVQKKQASTALAVNVVYTNPFEKNAQYKNPFDEYQNPVDDLIFDQTQ